MGVVGRLARVVPAVLLTGLVGCATAREPVRLDPRDAGWVWPVARGRLLSTYATPRDHDRAGIDILGRHGQAVLASRDGRVVYAGDSMRGYGKTVILDHGDGVRTLYAHNSALLVQPGRSVHAGEAIARVGRSGSAATDHCHFEVRSGDATLDPLRFLIPEIEARR